MPSTLYNAIQRRRTEVLEREESAAREMIALYSQGHLRLSFLLDQLLEEIVSLRRHGSGPSANQIYRSVRYQQLLAIMEAEMQTFVQFADSKISEEQLAAVYAASTHSQELITLAMGTTPPGAPLPASFSRFNPSNVAELVGRLSNGSPTLSLLNQIPGNAVQVFRAELVTGILQGLSPREVARNITNEVGTVSYKRALTIARTEVLGSYREASLESYRQSSVVRKWRWTCSRNRRTCAMCLAMDGKEFPLSTPLGSHPNCRCTPIPVTASWEELGFKGVPDARPQLESGEVWFARQKPAVQEHILGKGKYDLFQRGELRLSDLIGYREDPDWGPSRWSRSLVQIQQGKYKPPRHALGL